MFSSSAVAAEEAFGKASAPFAFVFGSSVFVAGGGRFGFGSPVVSPVTIELFLAQLSLALLSPIFVQRFIVRHGSGSRLPALVAPPCFGTQRLGGPVDGASACVRQRPTEVFFVCRCSSAPNSCIP
jgi:hypothetical protein